MLRLAQCAKIVDYKLQVKQLDLMFWFISSHALNWQLSLNCFLENFVSTAVFNSRQAVLELLRVLLLHLLLHLLQ